MLAESQSAWQLAVAIFNIVSIDIVLAGDNAIVIAMAVRNLPSRQRRMGIIFGAGASVMLRAILTVATTQLLEIHYLKLIGGLLILWIAFKLLRDNEAQQESEKEGAKSIWHAVWMIIVADITMSLDNVLAVECCKWRYLIDHFRTCTQHPAGGFRQQSRFESHVTIPNYYFSGGSDFGESCN